MKIRRNDNRNAPRPLGGWRLLAAVAAAQFLGHAPAFAADPAAEKNWPQWRGPLATGVAPAAEPPVKWSETSNVRWKAKLSGRGSGTPIVWDDQIFIQSAVATGKKVAAGAPDSATAPVLLVQDQGGRRRGGGGGRGAAKPVEAFQFVLTCIDRRTGKTLWEKVAKEEVPHEGHHADHGYSSYSPVTDGKHVIASFGSRGLYCYDMQGNLKWQKDLGRMQTKMGFGEGSSPALSGDTVVVNWDHEGADFIVAFDKNTGNELWRQAREEDTSWSTPLIVEHEGKKQVVTAATKRIRSYDLETGKQVWESAGLTANTIPTPVAADGVLYAMAGFRGSALFAIRLGGTGDLTGTDSILWSHKKSTPYVPSPLLYDGRLYFFSSNNGILSCFDAKTGKPLIDSQRLDDLQNVYASPVGAAGRVYLVGRDGTGVVIKASDKLEVLATNKLDERIDASPAAVGTDLFLRGQEHLYCISEK